MSQVLCISTILLLAFPAYSSIDISCPSDLTIHLFEIDLNYESYGDPIVDAQTNYVLDKNIEVFREGCIDTHHIILTYTATDENDESSSCEQRIDIISAVFDDIDFPGNVDFDGITIEEAQNDPSTFPEQWELFYLTDFFGTHDDQLVFPPNGSGTLKIIRQWTILDWCTAQVIHHTLEIRILNYVKDPAVPFFTIEACNGTDVDILNFNVFTDQANFQLIKDSCELIGSDMMGYLNCIAEHNGISPDNHIILELEGPNDYLNGVSTLDLLLSQKHILSITPFTSVCELLSADTNNDGSVNVIDLLLMRKLILGVINEFPDSPSWKILNSTILDDNLDPDEQDLKFKKDEFPLTELELIAVKTGDVSGAVK